MKNGQLTFSIAFIPSIGTHYKKSSWLLTNEYMKGALKKHCGDVINITPVFSFFIVIAKILNKISLLFFKKKFDYLHSLIMSRHYGKIYSKRLADKSFDVIFAVSSSTEIAFLKTDIPIVYWSDVTFHLIKDYYPAFSNLWDISVRSGNIVEKNAINNSHLLTYSSSWAANSAIKDYNAVESKIHVISYGANIDKVPSAESLKERKSTEICRLLFLAVDWSRKGGDIAYETLLKLDESGIKSELIVCGCTPPKSSSKKNFRVVPFLDRELETDITKLNEFLLTSSFLFVPTRADCSPVVFCEASAFGLPIISTDTGGVSGMVKNGINGYLLPPEAGGLEYSRLISSIFSDKNRYFELVDSSRKMFDEVLNWDSWGKSMKDVFNKLNQISHC